MLREYTHLESVLDQMFRRWFGDDYFDLYLWYDSARELTGWQLCYGKPTAEHALTWRKNLGLNHEVIDDGESKPGKLKGSPVLRADGAFPHEKVLVKLRDAVSHIKDPDILTVLQQIERVPVSS